MLVRIEAGTNRTRHAVAALEDDRVVGSVLFELPLKEDLKVAEVEIDVPPEHRRRGIGTALWAWAADRAAREGRTVFQTEINVPEGHSLESWPGGQFALHRGFSSENVEDHLVVAMPFDKDRLAELERSIADLTGYRPVADRPVSYRIVSWVGDCPDELVQTLVDLNTAMGQDVPTGGMSREVPTWTVARVRENEERMSRNYDLLLSMALTAEAEPAGYTEIYLPHEDQANPIQQDTLVLTDHRGHNLGTALKAANLRQLATMDLPAGWLHTWTEIDNVAMQHVNARFGFTRVERMHEVELTV